MKKMPIFNSLISVGSYRDFLDSIFALAETRTPSYVCFANVHMLIEAHTNPQFNKIVNQANIVAPDGKPLSIFLRLFNGVKQERVCGMDIMPDLLRKAEALGKSVFLYGTTNDLLYMIREKAKREFPSLDICGFYAPPFRELTETERNEAIRFIHETSPDIILVALGCPKQEKWMAEHHHQFNSCMIGLGQAFRVYAGLEKRLPKWMRDLSLEWLYRLCLEPRRLWKRYMYTNTYFILLLIKSFISRPFKKSMQS